MDHAKYVSIPPVFYDQHELQHPIGKVKNHDEFMGAFLSNSVMVIGSLVISALMFTTVLAINEFIMNVMEKNFGVHEKIQALFFYGLCMIVITAVITVFLAEVMRRIRAKEEEKRKLRTAATLKELETAEIMGQVVLGEKLKDSVLMDVIDEESYDRMQDMSNGLLFGEGAQNFIPHI